MLNRTTATFLLVLATMFWGFAFVAQKNAMAFMEPLTFIGARYLLGGLAILPLALREYQRAKNKFTPRQWALLAFLSANFFLGSYLQQKGLLVTTVTNGGFLTGFYVFFVPIILLLVFRVRPHIIVWICAPLALAGIYLLNGATLDQVNSGDVLIIVSAVFWALHVLLLGFMSRETGMPIFISCLSFLAAGLMAEAGSFALETPTLEALSAGWIEIAYAGIFSTAIAFTLQAVGQLHVPPANAAIILSGEALFAALGAAVILGERLVPIGYLGAALIFAAIVMVETIPAMMRRNDPVTP
ncbi:DMT family transporter [Mariluticola halotolerans]|uniref:DMT family transporter n=1 Tax=Mariluticola halotolerans TaxID=2909283 RepID=UPI0026E422D0|nr:DMT family transporter [Mariluticola halotolerans]UJQ94474.1 DMT family transporter [Mariluticola halotolerans]